MPSTGSFEGFVADLATWMSDRSDSLICFVAQERELLVGMAWLVIYERVPNPDERVRLSGDLQSVYVIPEFRGRGVGAALVMATCDAADRRGLAKITVDSSDLAMPLYRRLGFADSQRVLQRPRVTPPAAAIPSAAPR